MSKQTLGRYRAATQEHSADSAECWACWPKCTLQLQSWGKGCRLEGNASQNAIWNTHLKATLDVTGRGLTSRAEQGGGVGGSQSHRRRRTCRPGHRQLAAELLQRLGAGRVATQRSGSVGTASCLDRHRRYTECKSRPAQRCSIQSHVPQFVMCAVFRTVLKQYPAVQ